ncbi:MAG: GNAT family N-acetyltransferase [Acidimicrobiales bacterium]
MGGGEVEIRPSSVADTDAYLELLRRLDAETRFLLWEPGERTITAAQVRAAVDDRDPTAVAHLVAVAGDQMVGFLVAHRGPVRRLRHRADFTMAVVDSHRGRGVGRELLRAVEAWAVDVGVERLELTVMADNERAIALYESCGYEHEGTKRAAIRVDGRPVDERMMAKWLALGSA